jgi:hypothetical protein
MATARAELSQVADGGGGASGGMSEERLDVHFFLTNSPFLLWWYEETKVYFEETQHIFSKLDSFSY